MPDANSTVLIIDDDSALRASGQVREALACVGDDAGRAGEILNRIRDQIKKAPPRKDRVDLNQAISEVIALAQGAIIENGVSVQTRLTWQRAISAFRKLADPKWRTLGTQCECPNIDARPSPTWKSQRRGGYRGSWWGVQGIGD